MLQFCATALEIFKAICKLILIFPAQADQFGELMRRLSLMHGGFILQTQRLMERCARFFDRTINFLHTSAECFQAFYFRIKLLLRLRKQISPRTPRGKHFLLCAQHICLFTPLMNQLAQTKPLFR